MTVVMNILIVLLTSMTEPVSAVVVPLKMNVAYVVAAVLLMVTVTVMAM